MKNNPTRNRERAKDWYKKNKVKKIPSYSFTGKFPLSGESGEGLSKKERQRKSEIWKDYKLSWANYINLYENQEGKCNLCLVELYIVSQGPSFVKSKMACVDHDHKTGKIRGLLCADCNKGLGNFKDNIISLRNAIEYLEKFY